MRLVADADLPHLDARPEVRGQLAHQLAEIDAAFGGEIEDQPRAVEQLLDPRQLHRQAALADLQQADALRLLLALLLLQPRARCRRASRGGRPCGESAGGTLPLGERRQRARDGADRRSLRRLDDDCIAGRGRPARRDRSARVASSASSGSRNECVRPTGVNLTLTNGRCGPELMSALYRADRVAVRVHEDVDRARSDLQHQPVGDDLRAGVALERRQRAVDR